MSDEISPEIAALLADVDFGSDETPETTKTTATDKNTTAPSLANKTSAKKNSGGLGGGETFEVDLTKKNFPTIEKFISDTNETDAFNDKSYYKTLLTDECDSATRVHQLLSKYLTCQDPKDKTVYRQQIVTPYWELVRSVAQKMVYSDTPECKRMMLRYGVVLPSLFTPDQKQLFSRAFLKNTTGEPIYYIDEWFEGILKGNITPSATDEGKRPAGKGGNAEERTRLQQLKTKNQGKIQNAETLIQSKENERQNLENTLAENLRRFSTHTQNANTGHKSALTDEQKRLASEMCERIKMLMKIDRELNGYFSELIDAKDIGRTLDEKISIASAGDNAGFSVNSADFNTEFDTVRQMAKMSVGRMGNHFPIFTREFFHCTPNSVGLRENVIRELAWVESLDQGAFCRIHKNVQNRIVPYVILVPTYGDFGFCWEPFDRFNRVTSRGRIVIPMYPKNLQTAILQACADLRWQVAKEKASYYWMEEGLTGQYYQWFSAQKLKGDVKDKFIEDYILWMKFESDGMMKLEKEVRAIFWRHMPFPQERREMLRTRSTIYQELYQRDLNRSMSDGY